MVLMIALNAQGVIMGCAALYLLWKIPRDIKRAKGHFSYSITLVAFSLSMFFGIFAFKGGTITHPHSPGATRWSSILSVSFAFCSELSLVFNA